MAKNIIFLVETVSNLHYLSPNNFSLTRLSWFCYFYGRESPRVFKMIVLILKPTASKILPKWNMRIGRLKTHQKYTFRTQKSGTKSNSCLKWAFPFNSRAGGGDDIFLSNIIFISLFHYQMLATNGQT